MADYIDKWQAAANLMDAHLKDTAKAVDAIQYMDVADVRPVVHGKWLDRSSGWTFNSECNKCGFIVHEQFIKTYKYCPNCGADMRGEKDV